MAMQSGFIKRIRDIMRMDAGINGDAQRIEQMVWMLFLKVYDAKEDDWELNEDNYESIIPEDLRWRNWAKADENGHAMTGDKLLSFVNNTLFPVLKGNDVKESEKVLYEGIQVTPDTPIKKAIVKSTFEDANNYMKDGVYLRQVIDVIDEIEFDDVKSRKRRILLTSSVVPIICLMRKLAKTSLFALLMRFHLKFRRVGNGCVSVTSFNTIQVKP